MLEAEYRLIIDADFSNEEELKKVQKIIKKYNDLVELKINDRSRLIANSISGHLNDVLGYSKELLLSLKDSRYSIVGGFSTLRNMLEVSTRIHHRYCMFKLEGNNKIHVDEKIPKFISFSKYFNRQKKTVSIYPLEYVWEINRCKSFRFLFALLSNRYSHNNNFDGVIERIYKLERIGEIKRIITILQVECLVFALDIVHRGMCIDMGLNEYYIKESDVKRLLNVNEEEYRAYLDRKDKNKREKR